MPRLWRIGLDVKAVVVRKGEQGEALAHGLLVVGVDVVEVADVVHDGPLRRVSFVHGRHATCLRQRVHGSASQR